MPSGPKKRKALKKKKELEVSHNENHHEQQSDSDVSQIHGDDDLKHHDGKESEGDDVSSPASPDLANHQHQHQFTDGEKEEVEKTDDCTHVQLLSEENKFTEGNQENGEAVKKTVVGDDVRSDGESQTVGKFNMNNMITEHVEPQKKSGDGVLSEIRDEECVVQIERENKHFEELDSNNATVEDVEHKKEFSEGGVPLGESHIIDEINVVVDSSPFVNSTEAADSLSKGLIQVLNPVPVGELYGSVTESGTDIVTDNTGLVGEKMSIDTVTSGDSFMIDNAVIHGIDENGKKEENGLDQKDTSLHILNHSVFENEEDEAIVATNDALGVSDEKNSANQEPKEMSLSDIAPSDEAMNRGIASDGAECGKYSEVRESSDNQPLLGSAAHPVQRTSWLSCCGLLDVLGGSHR